MSSFMAGTHEGVPYAGGSPEKLLVQALHGAGEGGPPQAAGARSAWRGTPVMSRRDAACEIIFSGTSSSTPTTRAAISGASRSRSPTAQSSAISPSVDTSANPDSASVIPGISFASSTVTDTLTSDVVTTSTAVENR